jgi:hypothetical protein
MTEWNYTSEGLLKSSGNAISNEKYKSYLFLSGQITLSGTESYQIYYPTYSSPPRSTKIIRQVKNYSALERV